MDAKSPILEKDIDQPLTSECVQLVGEFSRYRNREKERKRYRERERNISSSVKVVIRVGETPWENETESSIYALATFITAWLYSLRKPAAYSHVEAHIQNGFLLPPFGFA